jgi:hypothetical protein
MKRISHFSLKRALLILAVCALSQPIHAAIFKVTTSEELQAALSTAAANGGDDEILLAPGTYFGSFKYFSEEDFALKVTSELEANPAVIDAQKQNFGFYIEGNKTRANVELSNLVIRNAFSAAQGGGLLTRSIYGSLFLDRIVLEGNTAREGGGLYAANVGKLILSRSVLRNNLAAYFNPDGSSMPENGGGASLRNVADVDLQSSVFEENRGSYGGALFISNQSYEMPWASTRRISVRGLEFLLNDSGTLFHLSVTGSGNSELTIEENYFAKNVDRSNGLLWINAYETPINLASNIAVDNECRAIALMLQLDGPTNAANELLVEKNTFAKNSDCKWFYLESLSDRSNHRAMIRSNLLQGSVLGFRADRSGFEKLSLLNNTFVGFDEPSYASFGSDFEMTVANNIFYSPVYETGFELRGVLKKGTLKNNIFQKITGYWDIDEGNQTVDPKFFDVEGSDFHLSPDSPAIDAGDNSFVSETNATDLDGNPRIGNSVVDIGAYERETSSLHPADINGDQTISQTEFDNYNAAWRTNELWTVAPEVIPVDFVTRAGFLLQKGGTYKNIGVGKPQTWVPLND